MFAGILTLLLASAHANVLEGLDFRPGKASRLHFPAAANDRLQMVFHQQMRHHNCKGTCEECAVRGMHAFGSWKIACTFSANHDFNLHPISLAWRPVA